MKGLLRMCYYTIVVDEVSIQIGDVYLEAPCGISVVNG